MPIVRLLRQIRLVLKNQNHETSKGQSGNPTLTPAFRLSDFHYPETKRNQSKSPAVSPVLAHCS